MDVGVAEAEKGRVEGRTWDCYRGWVGELDWLYEWKAVRVGWYWKGKTDDITEMEVAKRA